MAVSSRIFVYDEQEPELNVVSGPDAALKVFGSNEVITIYEPGPQGAKGEKGDRGETGFSGAGEPFFVITSGSLYATTASLAIFSAFSSSLYPSTSSAYQSSFDLGTQNHAWRNVYLSESIFIVKNGATLVTIKGSENTVQIGDSRITTGSFGFDTQIVRRIASNQQTYTFASSSVSTSFDANGVFVLPDFSYLPEMVVGGLIKSGSNIFIGI